jgi:predicted P-loop ATPase
MPNDAAAPVDWMSLLQKARGSGFVGNEFNCVTALDLAPEFAGCLAFDLWHDRLEIRTACPAGATGTWQDSHTTATAYWLQSIGIQATRGVVDAAVDLVARRYAHDPVLDYFGKLSWDKEPRLDDWLTAYCKAEDTAVTRLVGRKFLISLAARAHRPGAKADHMLILEGRQGARKSTVAAVLGGPWHSQDLPDFRGKDSQLIATSYLVIEIPDLAAFPRAEWEHIKSFVTRNFDTFRVPYGRRPVTRPRRGVFIATHNPTGAGYLEDQINRRFWPVSIGDADTDSLARDRDQLLAEAAHCYHAGEPWWVVDEDERDLLERAQEQRVIGEPWEDAVGQWAAKRTDPFTILEAACGALAMREGDVGRSATTRIGSVLGQLGYVKYRGMREGRRVRLYSRAGTVQL